MKSKNYLLKNYLLSFIIFILAIYLGFKWFDWKFIIVISLFLWANNMSLMNSKIYKKWKEN